MPYTVAILSDTSFVSKDFTRFVSFSGRSYSCISLCIYCVFKKTTAYYRDIEISINVLNNNLQVLVEGMGS